VTDINGIYRVLDANLNRLREALRVLEEYFRFLDGNTGICVALKGLRHDLIIIETALDREMLLKNRDTATDCFANGNRPEELTRSGPAALLAANFKRAQEAARVIEEYAKIVTKNEAASGIAKKVRFSVYTLEKETVDKKIS
jgi:thiamine-phosphate pyrophosphorylase